MLVLLKFLLILQILTCHCVFYYDDEYSEKEGKREKEREDEEIEYDDESLTMLVAGGYRPMKPLHAQYVVSIRTLHATQYFGDNHYCAGTLIGYRMVLTAGHCVVDIRRIYTRARRINVVLGTPNRLHRTSHTEQRKVITIFVHPQFKRGILHDIAILYMDKAIPFNNPNIKVLSLTTERPKPGTKCVTLGWGQLLHMGPYAAELVYADLEILDSSECQKYFGDEFDENYSLCVADWEFLEKGACRGDSGGPLICDDTLAGVISLGMNCGKNFTPNIYTDIYAHREWIFGVGNLEDRGSGLFVLNYGSVILMNIFVIFWS